MLFFFKQKTAYEMRISDWSSDVCSSDLAEDAGASAAQHIGHLPRPVGLGRGAQDEGSPGAQFFHFFGQGGKFSISEHDSCRQGFVDEFVLHRSEERRVGKECVSKCRSRW